MTTQNQHTPTPWHIGIKPKGFIYGPKGEQVADLSANLVPDIETVANAAFIVRACNTHDELVGIVTAWVKHMENDLANYGPEDNEFHDPQARQVKRARELIAALAKADALAGANEAEGKWVEGKGWVRDQTPAACGNFINKKV